MPSAPPPPRRACAGPRCPGYAERGSSWCGDCRATHARRVSQERGSASSRGYGVAWRRLQAHVLNREPLCRQCSRPATDVDHIIPRSRGGTDDLSNLQPLDHSCHSRKTMLEDGGYRGAAAAAGGR